MAFEYSYRLTRSADTDLDDIIRYIAVDLSNKTAATHFMDLFQKAVDDIRSFPEMRSAMINGFIANADIRKKPIGNYVVYYIPDHEEGLILVLRILHSKRNLDEMIHELDI